MFVNIGDDKGAAPKFVNAVAAVVAPVPPLAIATVPVTLPAVVAVVAFPVKLAVIVPAEKLPLTSLLTMVLTVFIFVAAFTLVFKEVILEVLDVVLFVTEVILVSKVVMVEEFTPPTVLTVGEAAVPLKSPANCMSPFADVDASDGAAVATAELTKAVVAICIVFVPAVAVGACGTPVNKGDAKGAAPVTSATGILALAVIAVVPVPLMYPVSVLAPVPPLATAIVPEILPAFTVDETDGIFNVVPDKVAAPVPVVVKVNAAVAALP